MVQAWFMNKDEEGDQREERQCDPPRAVSLEDLKKLGVLYSYVAVDDNGKYREEGGDLHRIKEERGYNYEDTITVAPDKLPGYEEKIKSFFEEHLHTDEEIRFILDGCGYFDVRNKDDEWIRIKVVKGDLLVLPAGIYHRFTTDKTNYICANRLFVGEPVWKPHNRPADEMSARLEYLKALSTWA
ncbi:acireductone dioxygenase-like [Watersipora subatra]|uniref:acireductone dioxygenase-like n=1 Tax=Watersipora subatra TaxID=2589382 RepID=UPI00355B1E3F